MRSPSEMGVFVFLLIWMVFAFGVSTAQFKILGLLDPTMGSDLIDSASPLVKIESFEENHSDMATSIGNNGQARGLSDEQLDKTTIVALENATLSRIDSANIIKVRIMEDESSRRRLDVNEPAIIDNAIGINNGLEADDILQTNSAPLLKPSKLFKN